MIIINVYAYFKIIAENIIEDDLFTLRTIK